MKINSDHRLSSVEIPQYKAWTVELLRALQENPLTAALKNGVVSGDTTQIAKPYACVCLAS